MEIALIATATAFIVAFVAVQKRLSNARIARAAASLEARLGEIACQNAKTYLDMGNKLAASASYATAADEAASALRDIALSEHRAALYSSTQGENNDHCDFSLSGSKSLTEKLDRPDNSRIGRYSFND